MPFAFCLLLSILEFARLLPAWRGAAEAARKPVVIACFLSAVAAFASGYHASSFLSDLSPGVEDALGSHHAWGRMALISAVVVCALFWIAKVALHGRQLFIALYYAALSSLVVLTVWTGFLGGELVFTHNISATLVPAASLHPEPTGTR
jgi:hypothetical protein